LTKFKKPQKFSYTSPITNFTNLILETPKLFQEYRRVGKQMGGRTDGGRKQF